MTVKELHKELSLLIEQEHEIDKFIVDVAKKGCKMAIYDHDEKACDVDEE